MATELLDDEAIEAFFLGTSQSVWEQDHALLTLAEEVRVATGGPPPRPDGALLSFLEDVPAASAVRTLVAVATIPTAATTPWPNRPRVAPAAPADRRPGRHLLSRRLRVTTGIAAGIGIAAASLTVAGTTGFLPDPAMRAIVHVIEAVTPFELSQPSERPPATVPAPAPATTSTVPAVPGAGTDAVGQGGPTEAPAMTPPPAPSESASPTVQGPGQPGSTGLDRAGQTPAGPFIPPFVTGGSTASPTAPTSGDGSGPPSTGVDRARETPTGTFIPPFAGGPPGRR